MLVSLFVSNPIISITGIVAWAGSDIAGYFGGPGYFNGPLDVIGQITAGGKDFKIDHPFDLNLTT